MLKLTPRQAEILAFIKRCLDDNGYPPTRAEIALELGFKSPNAAEEHLKALARKGAIEMTPGASRGIRIPGFEAKADHKPSLEDLLEILVEQALVVQPRSGNDLSIFMRLLGLAFSQSQGHLRRYLEDMYGKVFRRYMLLVNEAAPRIPPIELFWRVHFMLGAAAFSMSGIKALRAIAETDFGVNTSIEQVMRLMVPFLAAGMRAETGVTDPSMAAAQLRPRSKTAPIAKV